MSVRRDSRPGGPDPLPRVLEPDSTDPRPILVTGPTGNAGRAVVQRLLAKGLAVRVATRRPTALPQVGERPCRWCSTSGLPRPGCLRSWAAAGSGTPPDGPPEANWRLVHRTSRWFDSCPTWRRVPRVDRPASPRPARAGSSTPRLPASSARGHGAARRGAGARRRVRAAAGGGRRGRPRSRPRRAPALRGLRDPGQRLCAGVVRALQGRPAGRLLLQGPWDLSELWGATDGGHGGALGRARAAGGAVPAVGALAAGGDALSARVGSGADDRRADRVPARYRSPAPAAGAAPGLERQPVRLGDSDPALWRGSD